MDGTKRTLGDIAAGASGYVSELFGMNEGLKHRLLDMGITPGVKITVRKVAPMGDPIEIELRGYSLSLRKADAEHIAILNEADVFNIEELHRARQEKYCRQGEELLATIKHKDKTDTDAHKRAAELTEKLLFRNKKTDSASKAHDDTVEKKVDATDKPLKIALAGNPNCGKTTLFNAMTGSKEYVGNWPGVTVEKKEGKIKHLPEFTDSNGELHRHDITVVDLPGIYSLSPYSMEEIVARKFIIEEKPDAIINIVDATNIERNLYLTIQFMELETPMILALNMMDEVKKNGDEIDCTALSRELGIPVVPISARTGMGINKLLESCNALMEATHVQHDRGFNIEPDHVYDAYTHYAHHAIGELVQDYAKAAGLPVHYAEIKLLEGDRIVAKSLSLPEAVEKEVDKIIENYKASYALGDNETIVADSRYVYIESVVKKSVKRASNAKSVTVSEKIDRVLTNKYLAIPIFIVIMLIIFALTFSTVGAWLSGGMSKLVELLSGTLSTALTGAGAQQWFISLVCDGIVSGVGGVLTFLPQIAILFFFLSLLEDSGYMSRIAFIMDKPMRRFGLSGKSFIPLLMGFGCTVPATMGTRTMDNINDKRMTILLLPFMSCSAKLPVYSLIAGAFFAKGNLLVILSLYLFGVLAGIVSGLVMRKTVFKTVDAPFLIELPNYRVPTTRNTLTHVWERVSHFIVKAGTLIFAMSVVLWFLMSFNFSLTLTQNPHESILGVIGGAIAPVFTPNGFPFWQAAVALLAGIVAKEAVVSSFAMFYGFSEAASGATILGALSTTFTPAAAYSFLIFVLLYTPCVAAVSTMHKELGSRKWTFAAVAYQIVVAYVLSAIVYFVLNLFM